VRLTTHEITLIGIGATLVVGVYNAIRIRVVHILVNSNLTKAQEALIAERQRSSQLAAIISGTDTEIPPRNDAPV
jgi:hypothetical protein